MPDSPPRRLNLVDGMILIAGSAACFLLTRHYFDEYYPDFVRRMHNISPPSNVSPFWVDCYLTEIIRGATLWLGMFSPLLLLIRLRHPRPVLADLLRQPGTLVTVAATLVAAVGLVGWAIVAVITGQPLAAFLFRVSFTQVLIQTGAVVAVVWTVCLLSGQWSAERSLIDRSGRFLGVCWIIAWLAMTGSNLHQGAILGAGDPWIDHRSYTISNLIDHN